MNPLPCWLCSTNSLTMLKTAHSAVIHPPTYKHRHAQSCKSVFIIQQLKGPIHGFFCTSSTLVVCFPPSVSTKYTIKTIVVIQNLKHLVTISFAAFLQWADKNPASTWFSCFYLKKLSGQSAGEAFRSWWLTWQPSRITLSKPTHSCLKRPGLHYLPYMMSSLCSLRAFHL